MTMDKNVFFIWLMFLWLVFMFASKLPFSSLCSFKDDAKVGLLWSVVKPLSWPVYQLTKEAIAQGIGSQLFFGFPFQQLSMGLSMVFRLPSKKSITPNDSLHRRRSQSEDLSRSNPWVCRVLFFAFVVCVARKPVSRSSRTNSFSHNEKRKLRAMLGAFFVIIIPLLFSSVPVDLQSPMLTLALKAGWLQIRLNWFSSNWASLFSRIANADIRCWRIANTKELVFVVGTQG